MKYKKFVSWCNDRAADGCWSYDVALHCIKLIYVIESYPFWKRQKIWHELYEEKTVNDIVNIINSKISNSN